MMGDKVMGNEVRRKNEMRRSRGWCEGGLRSWIERAC